MPVDTATDVPLSAVHRWTSGDFANTHDVYLGTSFEDVNAASRQTPKGILVSQGQEGATYEPVGLLKLETTYYWRVDGVNAPPDSPVFKSPVWSFTAEPYAYPRSNVIATASSSFNADSIPQKTVDGSGLNASDQHDTVDTNIVLLRGKSPPDPGVRRRRYRLSPAPSLASP